MFSSEASSSIIVGVTSFAGPSRAGVFDCGSTLGRADEGVEAGVGLRALNFGANVLLLFFNMMRLFAVYVSIALHVVNVRFVGLCVVEVNVVGRSKKMEAQE